MLTGNFLNYSVSIFVQVFKALDQCLTAIQLITQKSRWKIKAELKNSTWFRGVCVLRMDRSQEIEHETYKFARRPLANMAAVGMIKLKTLN